MKKLMIGLFAVCAAVAAQAAYVDWQYEGKNAKNDTSWGTSTTEAANGYTAYLLTAAAYNEFQDSSDPTKYNVTKAGLAEKALDSSTLIWEKTTKSVSYYTTHPNGVTTAGPRPVSVANATDYYYVILANDDGYSVVVDNVQITGYSDPSQADSGMTPGLLSKNMNNATMVSNMKAYSGVPEPTSGILMLVGLGALALRRRKA